MAPGYSGSEARFSKLGGATGVFAEPAAGAVEPARELERDDVALFTTTTVFVARLEVSDVAADLEGGATDM